MELGVGAVAEVARKARDEFENGTLSQELLVQLYADYCTNIDTTLFVREALRIFPVGNCGLASLYLRHQLRAGNVTYGSYDGKGHTIWHIGRSIMADITGDQFGGPDIYVGPLVEPWSLEPPH